MANSYKIKTYPTLHPWKPLHAKIIQQFESYPNKADFLRTALEFFATNGFPGIEAEPEQQISTMVEQKTIQRSEVTEDDMTQEEMELALGEL